VLVGILEGSRNPINPLMRIYYFNGIFAMLGEATTGLLFSSSHP
jgi:hypothetical protein